MSELEQMFDLVSVRGETGLLPLVKVRVPDPGITLDLSRYLAMAYDGHILQRLGRTGDIQPVHGRVFMYGRDSERTICSAKRRRTTCI